MGRAVRKRNFDNSKEGEKRKSRQKGQKTGDNQRMECAIGKVDGNLKHNNNDNNNDNNNYDDLMDGQTNEPKK